MNPVIARLNGLLRNSDAAIGLSVIGVLMLMIVPLRPWMLDIFLTISIATSIGVLVLAVYTQRPTEFSVFPTLLLIMTLFRLSLNVASTRLILSHGHMGTGSAGSLIRAFGDFVVEGNYVVGLIVFVILVIINFVVITKGSGRVSEVAARFVLDAMPGKQMAIDADLNAGIINEEEARKRRKGVEQEADFYGAMDGASKFVRGDAIAGILITLVNIVGGLIIGVAQRGMDAATAAKNYTLLTVGEGLVAQVPALVVSTAAGVVVTRASSGSNFGDDIGKQLFFNEKVLYVLAGVLFGMGVVLPGTFLPFSFVAALCAGLGYLVKNFKENDARRQAEEASAKAISKKESNFEPSGVVETLQLDVGYGLISLVDSKQKGDLLERIQSLRKQFAEELGIVVPPMNIRDNLQLKPGEYCLNLKGNDIARGDLMVDHFLAMDPGGTTDEVDGIPTKEPVFGLDALWIHENNKELAQLAGYTVVDNATVIATHISEVLRKHAHEMVGRQETQTLLEFVRKSHPKVVDDLIPKELSLGVVVNVLQNLLREGVPIRDLVGVLEALGDAAATNKDIDHLTETARMRLARGITKRLLNESGELSLFTFSRDIEEKLIGAVQPGERPGTTQMLVEPTLLRSLIPATNKIVSKLGEDGVTPVLLVTPMIRNHVKKMLDRFLPQVVVLSHNEIAHDLKVKAVGTVNLE